MPVILGAMAASKCGTPLAEQSLLDAGCGKFIIGFKRRDALLFRLACLI